MADEWHNDVAGSYDTVASEYVARIYRELDGKPFDRELLDRFADRVRGRGRVCDLGCGPGHVARYLKDRGVDVFGVDLSPGMVAEAARLSPDVEFVRGDMRRLELGDGALAAIAAFYSLIHISREELPAALAELRRVLAPGGLLLAAFHVGTEALRLEELWGLPVSVEFVFFEPAEMERRLAEAGFEIVESLEREPYEGVEHPSRRAYILARSP